MPAPRRVLRVGLHRQASRRESAASAESGSGRHSRSSRTRCSPCSPQRFERWQILRRAHTSAAAAAAARRDTLPSSCRSECTAFPRRAAAGRAPVAAIDAVRALDDRQVDRRGQRDAHHRSAHDEPLCDIRVAAAIVRPGWRSACRCRASRFAGSLHAAAGDGDDAADQRFAIANPARDRRGRADVLAHDADVRRQAAAGNFLAGDVRGSAAVRRQPDRCSGRLQARCRCGSVSAARSARRGFGHVVFDRDRALLTHCSA